MLRPCFLGPYRALLRPCFVDVDGVRPVPPAKKCPMSEPKRRALLRVDGSRVVAIAALITNVAAVWIAWDESRIIRRSQRAAFMPIVQPTVEFELEKDSKDQLDAELRLELHNVGSGVARIEGGRFTIDGEPVKRFQRILDGLFGDELSPDILLTGGSLPTYLPASQEHVVLAFSLPRSAGKRGELADYVQSEFSRRIESLGLEVCYCSLFDECWVVEGDEGVPNGIDSCPYDDDPAQTILRESLSERGLTRDEDHPSDDSPTGTALESTAENDTD